jgi:hypothetical protein
MTGQLVFVHGRSQEHKDAVALKGAWIAALREGLAKNRLDLPIPEADIRFPYYGETLFDLVSDGPHVAEVIVRGPGTNDAERDFQRAVLQEVQNAQGISDDDVEALLGTKVIERGPLNWEWVQGILKILDQRLPGGSAATVALATHDVYQYLKNPGIRDVIEGGVRSAFTAQKPTVVVSHSLGTVVAFNLLRREGELNRWSVPLFVTLGSPLAITAVKRAVSPIEHPSCVGKWYNARDARDVVALYPLDKAHFDIDPAIENSSAVHNRTDNRHGISGYLDDKDIARRIYDALTIA